MSAKICRKCSKHFVGVRCKDCEKVAKASYRKENQDKIKAYDAIYSAANAEERRQYQAQYRAENPEKAAAAVRKSMIAYSAAHPERIAASKRKWRLSNMGRCRTHHHNRDARIKASAGALSRDIATKLMVLQRGKCANCAKSLRVVGYHMDHVTPIALGGENVDSNIQLLCPPCNLKKWAKHPIRWAQEQGRLL